ncbi:hypothetical protein P4O66_017066, partial [Electrophorus voltai]
PGIAPHPHQEAISLAAPDSCFWSNETNQFPYALAQPVAPASSSMDEDAATSSDRSLAAPPDVECAVCVGVKRRAQQACLECVASYCETHLDLHNTLHARKRHKLVEPGCLQERICPEHDKPLQVFCRTDQLCICHLCLAIKHKGHEVVAIKKEVAEKNIKLVKMHQQASERIQRREKEEEDLNEAVVVFKASAEEAMERSEGAFAELMLSMEGRRRAVTELIREKEEAVVKEARELVERARQEIDDLKRRAADLERLQTLSHTNDDICFLTKAHAVSQPAKGLQIPALLTQPNSSFRLVTEAVSGLAQKVDFICQQRFIKISKTVKGAGIVSSPLPTTWEEFLRHVSKLTIDPNTVHDKLHLSKAMELTAVHEQEPYPSHTARFVRRQQALCREVLCGAPCYWEVECGAGGSWLCVAVSYKGIPRNGRMAPLFGRCPRSWALRKRGTVYEFWHDNKSTVITSSFRCSRVGVYLDHRAGVLAFYNVTANMSLIHKVRTRFTEPVYAGFGLAGIGAKIKLCF